MEKSRPNAEGIDIIEIGTDIKRSIEKTVEGLPDSYNLLVVVKTPHYTKLICAILDLFVNDQKISGLYVVTNKPVSKLLNELEEKKIGTEKVYFIDCMSEKSEQDGKIVYCPPQDIADLDRAIDYALKEHHPIDFFVLDTLSTIFIYNKADLVEKFVTRLLKKISSGNMKGIFITTKTAANQAALDNISIFFDEVLNLNI